MPAPSSWPRSITGSGMSSSYNEIPLTIGGQAYNVKPNPWGGATQTIAAGDGKVFEVLSISGAGENTWDVISYPSVYKGGSYGGAAAPTVQGLLDGPVVLGPGCADPYGPKAVRASMGFFG